MAAWRSRPTQTGCRKVAGRPDLHHVDTRSAAISLRFDQPQNPPHPRSTGRQRPNRSYRLRPHPPTFWTLPIRSSRTGRTIDCSRGFGRARCLPSPDLWRTAAGSIPARRHEGGCAGCRSRAPRCRGPTICFLAALALPRRSMCGRSGRREGWLWAASLRGASPSQASAAGPRSTFRFGSRSGDLPDSSLGRRRGTAWYLASRSFLPRCRAGAR